MSARKPWSDRRVWFRDLESDLASGRLFETYPRNGFAKNGPTIAWKHILLNHARSYRGYGDRPGTIVDERGRDRAWRLSAMTDRIGRTDRAASTFASERQARAAIETALYDNADKIYRWLANEPGSDTKKLHVDLLQPDRSVYGGAMRTCRVNPTTGLIEDRLSSMVRVALVRDEDSPYGFVVVTAHPEPNEPVDVAASTFSFDELRRNPKMGALLDADDPRVADVKAAYEKRPIDVAHGLALTIKDSLPKGWTVELDGRNGSIIAPDHAVPVTFRVGRDLKATAKIETADGIASRGFDARSVDVLARIAVLVHKEALKPGNPPGTDASREPTQAEIDDAQPTVKAKSTGTESPDAP